MRKLKTYALWAVPILLVALTVAVAPDEAQAQSQCMIDCGDEYDLCDDEACTLYEGCRKAALAKAKENAAAGDPDPYKNYFAVCISSYDKRWNACAKEYNACMEDCQKRYPGKIKFTKLAISKPYDSGKAPAVEE